MEEYLKLQADSRYYYSMYCEERRLNWMTDKAEDWHDKYHFTKVKMDECKKRNHLVFAS